MYDAKMAPAYSLPLLICPEQNESILWVQGKAASNYVLNYALNCTHLLDAAGGLFRLFVQDVVLAQVRQT